MLAVTGVGLMAVLNYANPFQIQEPVNVFHGIPGDIIQSESYQFAVTGAGVTGDAEWTINIDFISVDLDATYPHATMFCAGDKPEEAELTYLSHLPNTKINSDFVDYVFQFEEQCETPKYLQVVDENTIRWVRLLP